MKTLFLFMLLALVACEPPGARGQSSDPRSAVLEKTIRHYYEVFDRVRSSGDASLIDAITDPEGVDRINVRQFVAEQQAKRHLSIITREVFSNWRFVVREHTATVSFDYQLSGYDIDPLTGQPLEPEMTLKPDRTVVELRRHEAGWLVLSRLRA